jgi:hypothetical protein
MPKITTISESSREAAIESLARELHGVMDRLDPSENPGWGQLSAQEKEFYRRCVMHLSRQDAFSMLAG